MITKKQGGLAVLEFTIVSTVLFIALFAIIELSRLVFSLQMLNEVTRKSARLATVCLVTEVDKITSASSVTGIAPSGFRSEMLKVDYLSSEGVVLYSGTGAISDETFKDIAFVRARVEDFSYTLSLLTSILGSAVEMPSFETILPSESLGIYRPLTDEPDSAPDNPDCL
ncbi:TadE/TadG family type IV pilus assembly protein [Vibrio breoganii]